METLLDSFKQLKTLMVEKDYQQHSKIWPNAVLSANARMKMVS